MSEFQVGPHTYSVGKLDAFRQFHIVRRLGPVAASLGIGWLRLKKGQKDGFEELLRGALEDLGKLSDEDANYVLVNSLSAVRRRRALDGGWDAITTPGGALMFPGEMDMAVMLQLVWHVLEDNLGNFLNALPSGGAPAAGEGARSNLSAFTGGRTG